VKAAQWPSLDGVFRHGFAGSTRAREEGYTPTRETMPRIPAFGFVFQTTADLPLKKCRRSITMPMISRT
jgi:hypothetical protein